MKRVSASGPVIQGFDIYHANAIPADLSAFSFCFLKGSEGAAYADPALAARLPEMRAKGLRVGVYHFMRVHDDPAAQIAELKKAVGEIEADDLPPVIDVEPRHYLPGGDADMEGLDAAQWGKVVMRLDAEIRAQFKRVPIIYGSPFFLESLALPSGLANPLWVADYSAGNPRVPAPWGDWMFHQYSAMGLDRNLFNGELLSMERLIEASKIA